MGYCGKCGHELDANGLCPNCEAEKKPEKEVRRKKLLPIILSVVLMCIAFAGVVYAGHAGYINLPFLQDKQNESETQAQSSESQPTEASTSFATVFSPHTAYASVLQMYREAFANNFYSENEDDLNEENDYDITRYRPGIRLDYGGVENKLYYCYYDICNDGISELIISIGDESGHNIIDILGYENGEVKRLFGLQSFLVRGKYSITANGYILYSGSGGASYSSETYYLLNENSASPEIKAELAVDYGDNGSDAKYYSGPEETQHEISENEYNTTVSQFGKDVELHWDNLCESKIYEAEFSCRGDNGINSGYEQLFVTNETEDDITVAFRQIGNGGYPKYVSIGTVFKVLKNGETSSVKWTDGNGNEFSGTVSYHTVSEFEDYFSMTYETSSTGAAVKQCTGAQLYLINYDTTNSISLAEPETSTETTTYAADFTPNEMWQIIVTNKWTDEEGYEINFTKNTTYDPSDYSNNYMGTIDTRNGKGYYYGHYYITEEKELRFIFNMWPEWDSGLLNNNFYEWDPTLQKSNSWCMTSDGTIMFSQGDYEFCGKTFSH